MRLTEEKIDQIKRKTHDELERIAASDPDAGSAASEEYEKDFGKKYDEVVINIKKCLIGDARVDVTSLMDVQLFVLERVLAGRQMSRGESQEMLEYYKEKLTGALDVFIKAVLESFDADKVKNEG